MAERDKDSHAPVSRRDFLALATGGAALAITGLPAKKALAESSPGVQVKEAVSLDTGGIGMERFESARKRAAAIVARMTLPEKVSQFGVHAPAIPRLNLPAFNFYASEALHGLIHQGPVTFFPLPLAMGCSWNRSLIRRVFTAVSDEIWAWHKKIGEGVAMFSPPTVNLGARDPRWGRIGENYSEDPCLMGQMAAYTIHGIQGDNPEYLKAIACAKHFIANDTEDNRGEISATVDPRSFWEYYTRGFETCVKEGHVFTVMCSYNSMNGIPTSASSFLLTDVLRKRWGFRGYVVSDCDAVADIHRSHHFASTFAEAAAMAVNAGCDINCGNTLQKYLGQAVDDLLISERVLDHSLTRSITGRILLGNLDPADQDPYDKIPISCLESPAHRELAREMGRQSIVLFKNENNLLPLDKTRLKKIAVIGPMADTCHLGNYSGMPLIRISPLHGIKDYLGIPTISSSYEKRGTDFVQISLGPRLTSQRLGWCSEGGYAMVNIDSGTWAAYDNVLFTGATEFQARVASGSDGGTIEVHLNSPNGPLVSKVHVPGTGGYQNWITVSAPLKPVKGEHKVYLRFTGVGQKMFVLEWFKFTPETPLPAPAPGPTEVTYARGCTVTGEKDAALFAAAVQAAKEADVALVFVGADQEVDRESHDRDYLHLPGIQHELVQAVHAANPKTILVISSNCPVAVNWEQDHLPAIVGGMFLGEQQGYALADVLFGDYNPGGKTSTTWYRRVQDLPDFYNYNIRNGRTYMYFQGDPLYPFGYGLSYTTFAYKNLQLSRNTLGPGGKITISVDVTNSGSRDGDEVVQAYVHVDAGTVIRPIKQLVAFERVHLKAGQTQTVSFDLSYDDRALQYWNEDKNEFVMDPGTVDVMIGASSADIRLKRRLELVA